MSSAEQPEEHRRQDVGGGGRRKTKKTHRSVSDGKAAADGGCWPCGHEKLPELKVDYDSTDDASTCGACRVLPRRALCKRHKSTHAQNTASRRFRTRIDAFITELLRQNKAQAQGITQLLAVHQSYGIPLPEWASPYLPDAHHHQQQLSDQPSQYYASEASGSAMPRPSNAVAQQAAQSNYSAYGYDDRHQPSYRAPAGQQSYGPSTSTVSAALNETNNVGANVQFFTEAATGHFQGAHHFTALLHQKYPRCENDVDVSGVNVQFGEGL
ncbi:hypothetical protein AAVH_13430 [Aphelenchoides avenae]|nr:hypothetical protein AAVH_30518 [Aphelenchus avenae]KAH7719101.1 hypothetical protein AAVH_13430 [Aphelenchus avenae]